MSEFANVCDPLLVLGGASLKESESSLMHGEGIHISYESFFNFVRSFQSEDNDMFKIKRQYYGMTRFALMSQSTKSLDFKTR